MLTNLPLAIYCGSLFFLLFIAAPVLLRTKEHKNLAGRFYGRILWRFYPVAFLLLLFYLIMQDEKGHAILLLMGLGINAMLSYGLKGYKRRLGDIDLVPFEDPRRVFFRRLSYLSTFVFFVNFILSLLFLMKGS